MSATYYDYPHILNSPTLKSKSAELFVLIIFMGSLKSSKFHLNLEYVINNSKANRSFRLMRVN